MSSVAIDPDADGETVEPEQTRLGQVLLERPEVRDVELVLGHQCAVIFVTFKTWSIPSDFARQYDMHLASASIIDDRTRWKRLVGIGRNSWIQGRFVRNAEVSVNE